VTGAGETPQFYVTGGTLPFDAPSYVDRRGDGYLYTRLRLGEFCYVFNPRQMGKSSLMVRAATRLRGEGAAVAFADLAALGRSQTEEQWYLGLLERIGGQLNLEDELEEFWSSHTELPPPERWVEALAKVLVPAGHARVVVFLDEVDAVKSLSFSTEPLFAAIRACIDRRREEPELARLAFCVLGVARPAEFSANEKRSPFEVGRRVELADFTHEEAEPLLRGLGKPPAVGRVLLPRVLYWTGGHPYLTQRLCEELAAAPKARRARDVDAICHRLFLSPGAALADDNLAFVRERLARAGGASGELMTLFGEIRSGRRIEFEPEDPLAQELLLTGAVRVANGRLVVRNPIYARALDPDLLERKPGRGLRIPRAGRLALTVAGIVALLAFTDSRLRGTQRVTGAPPSDTGILADGSRVKLELVSYGREHRLRPIGSQFRLPFLPRLPHDDVSSSTDELVFFLTRRAGPGKGGYLGFEWWGDAVAVDEHGCPFGVRDRSQRVVGRGGNSGETSADGAPFTRPKPPYDFVLGWGRLPAFPRRTDHFRLELLSPAQSPLCALEAVNPAPGKYPTWKAEPFPIVREQSGVSVVMRGVRLRATAQTPSNNGGAGGQTLGMVQIDELMPDVSVTRNGRPTDGWVADVVGVADATGNEVSTYDFGLCSRETAWKLRARLFRTGSAQFAASERWDLAPISLPAPGTVAALPHSSVVSGVTLRVLAAAGAGTTRYEDGVPSPVPLTAAQKQMLPRLDGSYNFTSNGDAMDLQTGLPHLMIQHGELQPNQWLTVVVADERGRPAMVAGNSNVTSNMRFFTIRPPDGARFLKVSVVVQTGKDVEFLFRPPERWLVQQTAEQPGKKIAALAFAPDGRTLLTAIEPETGASASEVTLTSGEAGKTSVKLRNPPSVRCAAVTSAGVVIAGGARGEVGFWSAATGERTALTTTHRGPVSHVAASADGRVAVTAGGDGVVQVWDVAGGKRVRSLPLPGGPVTALALSPDGTSAVVATDDRRLRVVAVSQGRVLGNWPLGTSAVTALSLSADGRLLVEGDSDGWVRTRDPRSGAVVREWQDQFTPPVELRLSPDGSRLVSVDQVGTAIVRNPRSGDYLATLSEGGTEQFRTAAVSGEIDAIVIGSSDRAIVRRWRLLGR